MPNDVKREPSAGPVFMKATLEKGAPSQIRCVEIGGQVFALGDGLVKSIGLEDEWYEDVRDAAAVIKVLRDRPDLGADIFTFWQRLPETEPAHPFPMEWDEIAALKITSYDHWWQNQIKSRLRTTIRRSEKDGLVVREVAYDDDFVRGMTRIFNESPIRQGRRFWHYGKDFATVKTQFARFVYRERMIGAFVGDEMIGFVMLGDAGRFALLGQILSSINHRDRAPNNALIAKSVELCANLGFEHLVYWYWGDDSLAEFKRRCGFEPIRLPRYYVPLTRLGRFALRTGAHRGIAAMLPAGLKQTLKRWRAAFHS
jgi:hypothetical protein